MMMMMMMDCDVMLDGEQLADQVAHAPLAVGQMSVRHYYGIIRVCARLLLLLLLLLLARRCRHVGYDEQVDVVDVLLSFVLSGVLVECAARTLEMAAHAANGARVDELRVAHERVDAALHATQVALVRRLARLVQHVDLDNEKRQTNKIKNQLF